MTSQSLMFDVEFAEEGDTQEYDWPEVEKRISRVIERAGVSKIFIAEMLSLDLDAPDYWERRISLHPIQTTCKVASYLGVSVAWLLTGKGNGPSDEPEKAAGSSSMTDVHDSAVVQGNSGTVVINHGLSLDDHQKELLRVYNLLPIKAQVALLKFGHDLEAQNSNSA